MTNSLQQSLCICSFDLCFHRKFEAVLKLRDMNTRYILEDSKNYTN